MQILAFLFFATIFGLTLNLIREMLNASHERIGAALAGDYRLPPADAAPVYHVRRRSAVRTAKAQGQMSANESGYRLAA
ncbi:MAG TPA: hypothetical protein PKA59_05545 [Chakrabartia sp.]|jgi:hypothetical protein|nr:hypothetical protein [Chakrabartia sp.]